MIDFNKINTVIDEIGNNEKLIMSSKSIEIIDDISQIELMKLIHEQFQIPAIKKLYPKWTEKVFWVIHGNIYHQFEDLSMDRLSEHIEQYITEHGYPVYRSQVPRVTAAIEQMNRSGWR